MYSRYLNIVRLIAAINNATESITNKSIVFLIEPHLRIRRLDHNEHGFISLISWLCILFEDIKINQVNFAFFIEKIFPIYSISFEDDVIEYRTKIRNIRTYFQHHLNNSNRIDKNTIEQCNYWFDDIISKKFPENETDWNLCLNKVIDNSILFLNKFNLAIQKISKLDDEFQENIIIDWEIANSVKLHKHFAVGRFQDIFDIVTDNFGLSLASNSFCRKRHQGWLNEINSLGREFIFEVEAQKLIERDLLNEIKQGTLRPPLTTTDIKNKINKKGRFLVDYLEKIIEWYNESDYMLTKEELLNKIEEYDKSL